MAKKNSGIAFIKIEMKWMKVQWFKVRSKTDYRSRLISLTHDANKSSRWAELNH